MIRYRMKHLDVLDQRTQLLTETIQNLHAIKLFAYEPLFTKRVAELRLKEAAWVKKMSYMFALADIIGGCMPAVAAVGTFLTRYRLGSLISSDVHDIHWHGE